MHWQMVFIGNTHQRKVHGSVSQQYSSQKAISICPTLDVVNVLKVTTDPEAPLQLVCPSTGTSEPSLTVTGHLICSSCYCAIAVVSTCRKKGATDYSEHISSLKYLLGAPREWLKAQVKKSKWLLH